MYYGTALFTYLDELIKFTTHKIQCYVQMLAKKRKITVHFSYDSV